MMLLFFSAQAQPVLTLDEAIEIVLKNNYGIQIVQLEKQITDLQNHPGYAGMLPTISATATYNTELSNTEQLYFSGDTRSEKNAGSTVFDGGVYLNYTLFDGFGMFATKEKLEQLAALGELEWRRQVEETVFTLMTSWYQLVQLQYAANVLDSAIDLSNERYQIARARESAGNASGQDVLQAIVDLNADSSAYINMELQVKNTKVEINNFLGRNPETLFSVNDKIIVDRSLQVETIKSNASTNNIDILLMQKDDQIVDLQIKELKAMLYPTLSLTGGYGYLKSTSEAGFVESNLSYGPSVGLTIDIPLFNGFTTTRSLDIAGLNKQITATQLLQTQLAVETYITTVYNQYVTALYLVGLQERNIEVARQNIKIALEQYHTGRITSVELREIQQTQIDAENTLLVETLKARLAELQLKKLGGMLITP